MASLQKIKSRFYIRFRFGRRPFRCSLETTDRTEAEIARKQVELTLHRIKAGMLAPPPVGADVAHYIVSGGKIENRIILPAPRPDTLRTLWEQYRDNFPQGAKDSLPTEKVHFGHFCRLIGDSTNVRALTTECLQRYINVRLKEPGRNKRSVAPDTVKPFAFAGLAENWHRGDQIIDSCTIITTEPNELMADIHDRMLVILPPADYDLWLDPEFQGKEKLLSMLGSYPAEEMKAVPVSIVVNNPRNDSAECIESAG